LAQRRQPTTEDRGNKRRPWTKANVLTDLFMVRLFTRESCLDLSDAAASTRDSDA